MVLWYHLIITAYGFWLPKHPRGSWPDFVGAWELYKFGPATKTNEKRSLVHDSHDVALCSAAKAAKNSPPCVSPPASGSQSHRRPFLIGVICVVFVPRPIAAA